jgi:oxygen-independent coproporphyrinogen III oxidase
VRVLITGVEDERFERPLRLIANLFFEETTIHFTDCEEYELKVHIDIKTEERIEAKASLVDPSSQKELQSDYSRDWLPYETEKERFRQLKTALSHVYLNVLQDLTGIRQKWGILTGIRPTKLIHKQPAWNTETRSSCEAEGRISDFRRENTAHAKHCRPAVIRRARSL